VQLKQVRKAVLFMTEKLLDFVRYCEYYEYCDELQ
jgi:hypothetical protein